jgi:hypothetical protein
MTAPVTGPTRAAAVGQLTQPHANEAYVRGRDVISALRGANAVACAQVGGLVNSCPCCNLVEGELQRTAAKPS